MSKLRQIKQSEIIDTHLACAYCGDGPKREDDWRGCCGESRAHFEEVYVLADENVPTHECEVVE